jgi:cell division septum initiation protein DivIVA
MDRIREVSPRYAALLEKNAELRARQEEIFAEIKPLSEQERRLPAMVVQAPKLKPKPVVRHSGAVELVGSLLSPQPEEEISPPAPRPLWPGEDRLRELGKESEAIGQAILLIAPELKAQRLAYSKSVAAQRDAEYKSVAADVVSAASALARAIQCHHEFITEQRLNGVAYSAAFRPLNLERFSNVDEPGSPLLQTVLDAVELGHVGSDKIPAWRMPADISLFAGGN